MAPRATALIEAWRGGDAGAFDELVDLLYDELRTLARRSMGDQVAHHTLQPTALVHEAWMRLAGSEADFSDRTHFMATAATVMRRVLIDHARAARAAKRGGGAVRVTLDGDRLAQGEGAGLADALSLDQALTRLGTESPRRARAIELRYFGGLTLEEVSGVLDVSVGTAHRDLRIAEAWLHRELST